MTVNTARPGLLWHLRIALLETRFQFLSSLRLPAFAVPTLLFPLFFYFFFAVLFQAGGPSLTGPTYMLRDLRRLRRSRAVDLRLRRGTGAGARHWRPPAEADHAHANGRLPLRPGGHGRDLRGRGGPRAVPPRRIRRRRRAPPRAVVRARRSHPRGRAAAQRHRPRHRRLGEAAGGGGGGEPRVHRHVGALRPLVSDLHAAGVAAGLRERLPRLPPRPTGAQDDRSRSGDGRCGSTSRCWPDRRRSVSRWRRRGSGGSRGDDRHGGPRAFPLAPRPVDRVGRGSPCSSAS